MINKWQLVCCLLLVGCVDKEEEPKRTPVSVSTLNIKQASKGVEKFYNKHKFSADYSVVGFQEVITIPDIYDSFGPTVRKGPSIHSESMIGLSIDTPHHRASENRKHQAALLTTIDNKSVLFVSVHLQAYYRDVAYEQAVTLVSEIQSYEYDELVVMGDFNITKDTKWFRLMEAEMESIGLRLVNAKGDTFEDRVIDYIFVSSGFKIKDSKVIKTKSLTDHNMVSVRLLL